MFTVTNYQPHKRNAAVQLLLMMSVYPSAIAEIKNHSAASLFRPSCSMPGPSDSMWREKQCHGHGHGHELPGLQWQNLWIGVELWGKQAADLPKGEGLVP